jgi:hypothetical protein
VPTNSRALFALHLKYDSLTMALMNPGKERERLTQVYGALTDEEIEEIAADSSNLTDIAREVLTAEVSRRRLNIQISDLHPIPDHAAIGNLVVIQSFRDLPEALLAKGGLESAGIDCVLADDNFTRLDWFISNAIGGVKILVNKGDADAAIEILRQGVPEAIELDDSEEYIQPVCPECQSLDVSLADSDRPAAHLTSFLLDVPFHPHSNRWKCNSCGIEWDPDPLEK